MSTSLHEEAIPPRRPPSTRSASWPSISWTIQPGFRTGAKPKTRWCSEAYYNEAIRRLLWDAVHEIPGLGFSGNVPYHGSHVAIIGWDTEIQRAMETEFTRLSTSEGRPDRLATAEANFDEALFLKKYLDIEVEKDRVVSLPNNRPSTPVVLLHSFLPSRPSLKPLLDSIPELSVQYVKDENFEERSRELNLQRSDRFARDRRYSHMVIGWDAPEVDAEVLRLEAEKQSCRDEEKALAVAAEQQAAAKEQERWHILCEPHRQYAQRHKPRPGPLSLKDLYGSYIVRWDGEGREYSYPLNARDTLRLDIIEPKSTHGVTATFEFGLLHGTILLGMSRRSVELLREEQPKSYEESFAEDIKALKTGQKRPLGAAADPGSVRAAMAKRQKTGPEPAAAPEQDSEPNRVYLQFAYKERHGSPVVDENDSQIGHLDCDTSKLTAKGRMIVPAYGPEPQVFSIFKVAGEPLLESDPTYWFLFKEKSDW